LAIAQYAGSQLPWTLELQSPQSPKKWMPPILAVVAAARLSESATMVNRLTRPRFPAHCGGT
jgi:hypothetical protein